MTSSSTANDKALTLAFLFLGALPALSAAPPAARGELLVTEIMFNPALAGADDRWEYVELLNSGAADVDLSGYVLDDDDGGPLAAANIALGTIPAGGFGVLFNADDNTTADLDAAWLTADAFVADINWIGVTSWPALANSGDRIGLWASLSDYQSDRPDSSTFNTTAAVDSVAYDDSGSWPSDDGAGSIYLTDFAADNGAGSNWSLSVDDNQTAWAAAGNDAGVGSPGSSAAVPEPSALALMVAAAGAGLLLGARRVRGDR